jgi:hypothetical protein
MLSNHCTVNQINYTPFDCMILRKLLNNRVVCLNVLDSAITTSSNDFVISQTTSRSSQSWFAIDIYFMIVSVT